MAQPGRLRRPGRGLKSKRIRQQTIQKTASHTEFLTLPQVDLPVVYKGHVLPHYYRLDVVVEEALLLELKAVEILLPLHKAQTLTYLRMSGLKTALLINFNVEVVRQGIRRISL